VTLRELRETKGLTQVQVADAGGIEQTTISQLELGKIQDPRHSTLQKLATVYDVEVQDVVAALAESIREAVAA
jgi:transcriptional regulator with XRE-family HTH domain